MFSTTLSQSNPEFLVGENAIGATEMRQLRRELGVDGLREVVAMFEEEGLLKLKQIALAVERQDADALRRAAHALQGAAANFGAHPLEALCRSMEGAARRGQLAAAASLIDSVRDEYHRVEGALEEECRAPFV